MHRPDIYRALLSTSPAHTHLFIVDYRGFGISTGVPSEEDLITDGAHTAQAILKLTGVSPANTVLAGQSLGTAVAIGAADLLARADPPVEFKALIPIAGFASVEEVVKSFRVFGLVPIIGPVVYLPITQTLISRFLRYPFHSDVKLERFVRNSRKTKVLIVHSFEDPEIPFFHGEKLVEAALRGALEADEDISEKDYLEMELTHLERFVSMEEDERKGVFEVVSMAEQQSREYVFFQRFSDNSTSEERVEIERLVKEEEESVISVPIGDEVRRISMLAIKWGGHNTIPKSSDVVLAIRSVLYND